MTIYTGTNASIEMKAVLDRTVGIMDIVDHANCKVLSVFRDDYCKLDADGGIEALANMADFELNFLQDTAENRPKLETDALTGRETAVFSPEATSYLSLDPALTVDLNSAFSYLVVFKLKEDTRYQRIMGSKRTTSDRSAIEHVSTKKARFYHTDVSATESKELAIGLWYCAIASYDGNNGLTFEVIGRTPKTATSTETKEVMDLMLGSSSTSLGFTGSMDMVAFFDKSVHADATLLADIKHMLKSFYGSALTGQ